MKEIDYIFQNLDTTGFLEQIEKESGEQTNLGPQVLNNVKNPNEDIVSLVEEYIIRGVFFQKVSDFILIYHGYIIWENTDDYKCSIICFYSKTDQKYRLLLISFEEKYHFEFIKVYKEKPSIQKIADEFSDRINNINKSGNKCYIHDLYDYEKSNLDLSEEIKEHYKEQINLER